MDINAFAYFLFGTALVVALAVIILVYYAKKRKSHVEEPKYRMMRDDEDE